MPLTTTRRASSRPRQLAAATSIAVVLALLAACGVGPIGDPFYTPPAELPSANGTLIRQEPFPLGVSLPGLDVRWERDVTRFDFTRTARCLAGATAVGVNVSFEEYHPSDTRWDFALARQVWYPPVPRDT